MNSERRTEDSVEAKKQAHPRTVPPYSFLKEYLGDWIESEGKISIIASPIRDLKGWDGSIRPVVGVVNQSGAGVLSLAPNLAEKVIDALGNDRVTKEEIASVAKVLEGREFFGVFRWSNQITSFDDIGEWIDATDPIVPEWLKPFGHKVLMAFDESGNYIGGVGIKHHLDHGREIAVVVEERAAGKQVARRLVSKAARHILNEGNIPIYLHAETNVASAKVAEAVGFNDLGWKIIGMSFESQ